MSTTCITLTRCIHCPDHDCPEPLDGHCLVPSREGHWHRRRWGPGYNTKKKSSDTVSVRGWGEGGGPRREEGRGREGTEEGTHLASYTKLYEKIK